MKPKIVKTFKQGASIVMTIPIQMAESMQIGPGDFLLVSLNGKKICAEKAPLLFQDLTSSK
jgi:antitoxin component of MazEF toxin-antitoxin module